MNYDFSAAFPPPAPSPLNVSQVSFTSIKSFPEKYTFREQQLKNRNFLNDVKKL